MRCLTKMKMNEQGVALSDHGRPRLAAADLGGGGGLKSAVQMAVVVLTASR